MATTDPIQMLVGSVMEVTLQDVQLPAGTPLVSLSGGGWFRLLAIINDGVGEVDPIGVTYPLNFAFKAGTTSDWSVIVDASLLLIAEQNYFGLVELDDGAFRKGSWRIPMVAKYRDALDIL
jgi:hypothetical protein